MKYYHYDFSFNKLVPYIFLCHIHLLNTLYYKRKSPLIGILAHNKGGAWKNCQKTVRGDPPLLGTEEYSPIFYLYTQGRIQEFVRGGSVCENKIV